MSTVLLLLYFNPWYLFILAVNIALIVGIALTDWAVEDDGRGMGVLGRITSVPERMLG